MTLPDPPRPDGCACPKCGDELVVVPSGYGACMRRDTKLQYVSAPTWRALRKWHELMGFPRADRIPGTRQPQTYRVNGDVCRLVWMSEYPPCSSVIHVRVAWGAKWHRRRMVLVEPATPERKAP